MAARIRWRTRGFPMASMVSKRPGVAVLPVIATRIGIKRGPGFIPSSAASPRRTSSKAAAEKSSTPSRALRAAAKSSAGETRELLAAALKALEGVEDFSAAALEEEFRGRD